MPRKYQDIHTTEFLHITCRTHDREFFPLPMDEAWVLVADLVRLYQYAYNIEIVAFLLMNNHYHMLARALLGNMSNFMRDFNRESAKEFNRRSGHSNEFWGERFYRCEINSDHYFMNVYKYLYQNPLRAGIVKRVEDYSYSTLPGLIGLEKAPLLVHDDLITETSEVARTMEWLNRRPKDDHIESIRKALRRKKFCLPSVGERPNPLETELI